MNQTGDDFNKMDCRCPVCGATQSWQEECRRCHTDISLLRQIADELFVQQQHCFEALKTNDTSRAAEAAARLVKLLPTPFFKALVEFTKKASHM